MRSYPSDYELIEASDLENALTILNSDGAWRPMAGGTDIMVLFNAGILPYRRLVSIRKLSELNEILILPDSIRIGASATYADIQRTELLHSEFPLLCKAANWTGSVANQNLGTLGGNIANGSPAADSPPALLVYDAELEIASLDGCRRIPYCDFHTGYKKMNLPADSLVLAIHLPRSARKLHQYARKVGARKAQAISKVAFHGVAEMEGKSVRGLRLALGSVAPVPVRCRKVEQLLLGQTITKALIGTARETVVHDIQPIDDIRSTAVYRTHVSQNLLAEFLEQLL